MQTRITIFFLFVSVYLLGLLTYSNHRALAATRADSELALQTSKVANFDTFFLEDKVSLKPKTVKSVVAPAPEPKLPDADPVIVDTIQAFNGDIKRKEAHELASLIEKTADRYDVDPLLVTALVSQESAFYADAVSPVGAIGLGQLMPYTAADLGVNPNDPAQNLDGCVRYLAQNLDAWAHTENPIALALASYNAGPGAVSSYGGIPPYEETQNYVYIITYRYNGLLSATVASTNSRYG
jgi:soluble lytic murein transglycosylase-like protein